MQFEESPNLKHLKKMTESLSLTERELGVYKHFMDSLQIGVMVIRPDGKVHYLNDKARAIIGSSLELKDMKIYRHQTKEAYKTEDMPIVRALNGKSVEREILDLDMGDETITLSVCATPIMNGGPEPLFAISTFDKV